MLKAFLKKHNIDIGEVFKINGGSTCYIIDKSEQNEYCLLVLAADNNWYPSMLSANVLESADITKANWIPRHINDDYYVPILYSDDVKIRMYRNDDIDNYYYSMGLMCKTEKEALYKLKNIQDYCKREFT